MAAALLDRALRTRGVEATVHSAGLLDAARPASPHAVSVMTTRGLDLGGHTSRPMAADLLEGADLIIAMERQHVREAAVLAPSSYPRTFTLKELARRAAGAGPRDPGVPVEEWLAGLAEGRRVAEHLGSSPDDDVADPYGRSERAFRRTADELEVLCDAVVELLWPARDRQSTDVGSP